MTLTVHQGEDYIVVMRDEETTDGAHARFDDIASAQLYAAAPAMRAAIEAVMRCARGELERPVTQRQSWAEAERLLNAAAAALAGVADDPPEPPSSIRIGITLEGGVVQDVFSNDPRAKGIDVYLIDYGTEGSDPEDRLDIPQRGGGTADGFLSDFSISIVPDAPFDAYDRLLSGDDHAEDAERRG